MIKNTLLIIVFPFLFLACQSSDKEGEAIITGKYAGVERPLTIYVKDYGKQLNYSNPIYIDTITTTADGHFSFVLPLKGPKEISLQSSLASDMLFVEANDSIYFESDGDYDSPVINIKGQGGDKLKLMTSTRHLLAMHKIVNMDSAAILPEFEKHVARYNTLLDSGRTLFSTDFINYITAQQLQKVHYFRSTFPSYYNVYKEKVFPEDTAAVRKAKADIVAFAGKGYNNSFFADDLFYITYAKARKADSVDAGNQMQIYNRLINELKLPEEGTQMMIGKNFLSYLSKGKVKEVEPLITEFYTKYPQSIYKEKLQQQFAEWKALSKGMPAPDFTAVLANNEVFKLSDLKGKVIYIDIWATWCGPCREEFKYAPEIKNHYKDNDQIAFLYVSVDEEVNSWTKYLQEHPEFEGVHVNDPGNFKSKIASLYKVNSIPRYLIIDREGNIFSTNAQRPSNKTKLIEQLDEALGVM